MAAKMRNGPPPVSKGQKGKDGKVQAGRLDRSWSNESNYAAVSGVAVVGRNRWAMGKGESGKKQTIAKKRKEGTISNEARHKNCPT